MNEAVKPTVNKRSLNVLMMLFSFSLLPFSGMAIHSTHGMSEYEPIRHFAMSVHNFAAIIFLTTAIIHLAANRKAIAKYIVSTTTEYTKFRREALIAFLFVLGLVGLFAMHAFHVR